MNFFGKKTVSLEESIQSELHEILMTEKMLENLRKNNDSQDSQFIDLNDLKESEFPRTVLMHSDELSDDINPVIEAQVYVEYKRFEQAREILEEGLKTHPHLESLILQKLQELKALESDICENRVLKVLKDAQHDQNFEEDLHEDVIEKNIEMIEKQEDTQSFVMRNDYMINLMVYEGSLIKPSYKIIRTKLKQGDEGFMQEVIDILKFWGFVEFCIVSIFDY